MTPTKSSDFTKELLDVIDKANEKAARDIWTWFMSFLADHWLLVVIVLISIFLLAIVVLLITDRWGLLGSVLYNYLYFGTLFIVGLIAGPEFFVSDAFHIAGTLILWPVCYFTVGVILEVTGLKRR